ncbi:hypothetical protein EV361DRAFT_840176 [Lentinula raphanica]|nr:hypothetical protein EV361DRAFT_840176 [Lentinula raphanica]
MARAHSRYKGKSSPSSSSSLVLGRAVAPVRFLPRSIYFASCKLHIRTRLSASACSNFWNSFRSPHPLAW